MVKRILFVSGREASYIRNHVLIKALQSKFEVDVFTPWGRSITGRTVKGLMAVIRSARDYDAYVAGFYGQPLAIGLAALRRKPLILDAYVSTFDTLCNDRQAFAARSPMGFLAAWLDGRSTHLADHVITDTQAHADYFSRTFGVPKKKLSTVYVGCDESIFYPRPMVSRGLRTEIFYYGAFLPLQGIDVIVEAAALLRNDKDLHFSIGGRGSVYPQIRNYVQDLQLENITFQGWIPFDRLPQEIAKATICLGGHFSTIPKAARVVSTKTFQFLAMRKPTIVGINPATEELFDYGQNVVGVPMGDPVALAEAINLLRRDSELRDSVAEAGYQLYRQRLTTQGISKQLAAIVEAVKCE